MAISCNSRSFDEHMLALDSRDMHAKTVDYLQCMGRIFCDSVDFIDYLSQSYRRFDTRDCTDRACLKSSEYFRVKVN